MILDELSYYYRNYVITLSQDNPEINVILRYFINLAPDLKNTVNIPYLTYGTPNAVNFWRGFSVCRTLRIASNDCVLSLVTSERVRRVWRIRSTETKTYRKHTSVIRVYHHCEIIRPTTARRLPRASKIPCHARRLPSLRARDVVWHSRYQISTSKHYEQLLRLFVVHHERGGGNFKVLACLPKN